MKKREVVKEKKDFNSIIQNGSFIKNKSFVIYIRKKKEQNPLFGIAVSKKLGHAVLRNKLKRRTRAILDEIKEDFPKCHDYIIMIKKKCVELPFQEMKSELIELIKEIK